MVERIRAEVIDEGSLLSDLIVGNAELLDDDAFDFIWNLTHEILLTCINRH